MHHWRRTLTGAVLLLLLVGSAASAGVTVQAEGEEYVDSYNLGGLEITKSFCSGASEYHAADGLDRTGEWIEVEIAVPLTGYYQPLLGYQTAYEDSASVRLTVLDEESKLGHSPLSKGTDASTASMVPPSEWPDAVWRELARQGKLRDIGHGFYELGEQ